MGKISKIIINDKIELVGKPRISNKCMKGSCDTTILLGLTEGECVKAVGKIESRILTVASSYQKDNVIRSHKWVMQT